GGTLCPGDDGARSAPPADLPGYLPDGIARRLPSQSRPLLGYRGNPALVQRLPPIAGARGGSSSKRRNALFDRRSRRLDGSEQPARGDTLQQVPRRVIRIDETVAHPGYVVVRILVLQRVRHVDLAADVLDTERGVSGGQGRIAK